MVELNGVALLEELVATSFSGCFTVSSVYTKPDIPAKKLNNAVSSYAEGVDPTQVVALYDSTVFGSGKEGVLVTYAGLYMKMAFEDSVHFSFSQVKEVQVHKHTEQRQGKEPKVTKKLHVSLEDGSNVWFTDSFMDMDNLAGMLREVLQLRAKGLLNETDKFVIVEDLNQGTKLAYVQALVNLTLHSDDVIDERELAEIQTLMTQISFSPELRQEVRAYLGNPNQELEDILKQLDAEIPKGSENAVHISLVKDMIRVHRSTHETPSFENEFIRNVAAGYDITDEQLEVIEQACEYDEKILRGEVDDAGITRNAKELAAKAGAVGLPIAAVYLSGSVVGLSAAGITSGLAALGLGGVLGFSAMVTGIGMLVLIGVGTYKGIQWITGGGKRDKVSKREFMIQEIIRINQRTINNMAEDVNFFAMRIVELTRETQMDKMRIEKLGKDVQIFAGALTALRKKGVSLDGVLNG